MITNPKKPKLGSAVLVEKDGKYLLALRNKQNYNGYWVIPGGGVEWGETLADAGVREIREETGLDVEIVKFIGFKELINVPGDYHAVTFFHLGKVVGGELKVADDQFDIAEAGFFSREEMKTMHLAESVLWVFEQVDGMKI